MKNKNTISLSELYNQIILENEITPLQKLKTCKITSDGKYIVYEGKAYFTRNGMQVPLNEEWSLGDWSMSDILHTGADIVSAGMDFIIPGSGAVVDILNAISYVIEAQFKPQEERDSLYIMAAITYAFVILPGPLQAIAVPLKRAVKTGVGMTSNVVVQGLKIIGNSLDFLLARIPSKIAEALKSPLAKNIMGKWGTKISEFIKRFTTRITELLKKYLPASVKTGGKTISNAVLNRARAFFAKMPKISKGSMLLKKLGFVQGKTYKFVTKGGVVRQGTIRKIVGEDAVEVMFKGGGKQTSVSTIKMQDFFNHAIGAPWGRRGYTVMAPLFIKRFTDFLDDKGMLDYNKIMGLPDLNPDATSKESLEFMREEVSGYEGDAGQYSVQETVKSFQRGLILLGKTMRGNDDGKFGPSTKAALESFQNENGLQSSLGRMDRVTAQKMAEVLNNKKPQGKYKYQDVANSLLSYTKKQ